MSTYQKIQQQKEAIQQAAQAFNGIQISEDSKINNTIRSLRSAGVSHFAIREGLKVTGLLDYEDEE